MSNTNDADRLLSRNICTGLTDGLTDQDKDGVIKDGVIDARDRYPNTIQGAAVDNGGVPKHH